MNRERAVQFVSPCATSCPKVHKLGTWKEGAYSFGPEGILQRNNTLLITKHTNVENRTKLSWRMEKDKSLLVRENELAEQRLREWIALKDRASFATHSPYALADFTKSLSKLFLCFTRERKRGGLPSSGTESAPPVCPGTLESTSLHSGVQERFLLNAERRSGASGHGAYFQLTNLSEREVTIHALHLACSSGSANQPQRIRIYVKHGSPTGFECEGSAWTCCLDADGVVLPAVPYPQPPATAAAAADAPQVRPPHAPPAAIETVLSRAVRRAEHRRPECGLTVTCSAGRRAARRGPCARRRVASLWAARLG